MKFHINCYFLYKNIRCPFKNIYFFLVKRKKNNELNEKFKKF